ncbi:hypothetical protein CLM82_18155 [Streptomyces albidoflavus]|nr:hypothetical protein CLM82_18155 [Streptomyces albidoflavus]
MVGVVTGLFSRLGPGGGWGEETLGFYGLRGPLMLALCYDRMVATGAGRGEAIRITSGSASGRHTDWSASWGATLHRTTQEP